MAKTKKKSDHGLRSADFCNKCARYNDDICDLHGYDTGKFAVCDEFKDWS